MSKRIFQILVVMMVVSIILTACAAPAATTAAPQATQPPAATKPVLAFSPNSLANPSQAFAWKMYQKYCATYGFDCIVLDGKGDVQEQVKAINNAVAQGVKVVVTDPNDAVAIVPALKAARAAGVLVGLSMSRPAAGTDDSVDFWVCVDNVEAGKVAAQAIMKQFPNGATGIEVGGQAGNDAAVQRHNGFAEGIKGTNITVLDYQNTQQWDTAQAQAIAEDMITKYGTKIQFVFTHWDNGATGVINALKAHGGMDNVMIIGVDGNKTGYEQVTSWPNYMSIAQNVETITKTVLDTAKKFLAKDPTAKHDNVPQFDIYNRDTIANFTAPEW